MKILLAIALFLLRFSGFGQDSTIYRKDTIKANTKSIANLKLQPDRNGTSVEIMGLELMKPAS